MNKKETNPKEAMGSGKVPFHAIPTKPLMEVGLAMMEGGRKYGTHNYRANGVRFSTYYNSTLRHMISWFEGEDIDPDSGVHHIVKAIAGLFVVRDSMHMGNFTDDRPVAYPDGIDMGKFNDMAKDILKQYPVCEKAHLQIDMGKAVKIEAVPLKPTKPQIDTTGRDESKDLPDLNTWICTEPGCYERGVANIGKWNYWCPDHLQKHLDEVNKEKGQGND